MNKAILKVGGLLLVAAVVLLMAGTAHKAEAGVGCGQMGTWLDWQEVCTSVQRNCLVVCAY
jgi:hypothetical protein